MESRYKKKKMLQQKHYEIIKLRNEMAATRRI